MIPRELVGKAAIPGHDQELRCYRHDRDFELWIDGIELMSSRVHGSEEALAELGIDAFGGREIANVLIGGLGMGYTLARTLALVPPTAKVVVAELLPEVVTWNRELFGHCAGNPLSDPRVEVHVGDVGAVIAATPGKYDAILLDVDNGPEGLTRPANNGLYNRPGLAAAKAALTRYGALAVWSSVDDDNFVRRMRDSGFKVQTHHVKARRTKGARRTIWIARRP